MYTGFYGFSEEPFNVNPEPKFLLLTETHRQALDSMVEGIKERRGVIVILGELGSGKTTLIQHLLNTIDKNVKAVVVFHPYGSVEELLEDTLRELGVPSIARDRASQVQQLNDSLQSLAPEETLAIIIDEAQDLSPEVMEELCLLPTPEMLSAKKLQILFVGQTGGRAKLESANLQELKQKIEVGFMSGLSNVVHWLHEHGMEPREDLVQEIFRAAKERNRVLTDDEILEICKFKTGERERPLPLDTLPSWKSAVEGQ